MPHVFFKDYFIMDTILLVILPLNNGGIMRHIFIINPAAGNGKYQAELSKLIKDEFESNKTEYIIYFSKFKGDVKQYLDNMLKDMVPSVIYACGGDGTLHEVINAACNYQHVSIGFVPCGSGNDFIKNFNNSHYFSNIEAQMEGESVALDLIKVNNEYAATVLNIGLDADVAFNMHKFKKIPFINGPTRYYLAILYCLFNKLGKNIEVKTDTNELIKGSFLIGVIANGQYYGSGYNCAPLAKINDGILDLCFVKNISRLKILNLLGSYKKGQHLENPKISKYVTYVRIKHAQIKLMEPTNVCMDGEKYIYNEMNISTERNSLRFWLPKGVQLQDNNKNETA